MATKKKRPNAGNKKNRQLKTADLKPKKNPKGGEATRLGLIGGMVSSPMRGK
jgi:hypothetical protein